MRMSRDFEIYAYNVRRVCLMLWMQDEVRRRARGAASASATSTPPLDPGAAPVEDLLAEDGCDADALSALLE